MVRKLQWGSIVFLLALGGVLWLFTSTSIPVASTLTPRQPANRKPDFFFSTPDSIAFCELLDETNDDSIVRLEELIKKGMNVNVRGKYGMTLLAWAFYRDKRVIFQQLLKAGANPEAAFTETFDLHLLGEVYSGETVPELATRNWLYGYTSECLPYMRDVNKRNDRGHTLLLCLAKTKRDDARLLFEQLLNRNDVELNVTTKSGSTALDGAMSEKNYEYVVALLKAGAEVDAGYRNGYGFRENLDSRYDYAFENEDKDALKQLDEVKSLLKD